MAALGPFDPFIGLFGQGLRSIKKLRPPELGRPPKIKKKHDTPRGLSGYRVFMEGVKGGDWARVY
jgi:hypothetical protein